MRPKGADGMANNVDPDQTALQEQSGLGLQCLPRPVCPKTYDHYGIPLALYITYFQFFHKISRSSKTVII